MARKKHVCFNCGTPSETTIQSRQRKGMQFICTEARCWNAYYKSLE
jgi:hypothetical protein